MRALPFTIRVQLYLDKERYPVLNLKVPVRLAFPLDLSIPSLKSILDAVFTKRTATQQQVISNGDIQCLFYDEATRELSD